MVVTVGRERGLEVVLGKNVPYSRSPDHNGATALATSYYADPSYSKLNRDGRVPMEDRKGAFSQFRPKNLMINTIRISLINVSSTLSAYFSDSLNHEQSVDDLVDSGELSQQAADRLNEDWESREWKTRTSALPKKVCYALARYHSCTLIMRFYESICGRLILKIDDNGMGSNNDRAIDVMDKLTRDTYKASIRTSQLLKNQEVLPGKVVLADGTEVSTSRELGRQMFSTCLWSNIIPFLAELTVQQGLLLYEYGLYYMNTKKRIQRSSHSDDEDEKTNNVSESAYALTISIQSTRLSVARGISLIVASFGGAFGTILLPGWGAVFGIQLGDSFVNALLD